VPAQQRRPGPQLSPQQMGGAATGALASRVGSGVWANDGATNPRQVVTKIRAAVEMRILTS
jgi:hypothetical protein